MPSVHFALVILEVGSPELFVWVGLKPQSSPPQLLKKLGLQVWATWSLAIFTNSTNCLVSGLVWNHEEQNRPSERGELLHYATIKGVWLWWLFTKGELGLKIVFWEYNPVLQMSQLGPKGHITHIAHTTNKPTY
jgi:hypothetical protein